MPFSDWISYSLSIKQIDYELEISWRGRSPSQLSRTEISSPFSNCLIETRVEVWKNKNCCGNKGRWRVFPQDFRVLPNFHECFYLTIRLFALDCYEVIGRRPNQLSPHRNRERIINCFSRILTEINADNGFQLFFYVLLNFPVSKVAGIQLSLANLQLFTRAPAFSIFSCF